MEEYKIDLNALLQEAMNLKLNEILLSAVPQSVDKNRLNKLLVALNNRGVSTQTFMDAVIEVFSEG